MSYIEISKKANEVKRTALEEKLIERIRKEHAELKAKYPDLELWKVPYDTWQYCLINDSITLLEAYEMAVRK